MAQIKTISFIIPAYNSEKYLYKCLNSFLYTENTNSKIEVIIVNDGSTDRTEEIGMGFVRRNPDIFKIINKRNGGHGSAINEGASSAKGTYLKVVDSDDWIITKNLESYISMLEATAADVILTPYLFYNIQDQVSRPCSYSSKYSSSFFTLSDVCGHWHDIKELFTIHGITYRTEFYREKSRKLTENVFYDDQEYTTIPCCYAKTLYFSSIFLYVYRIGDQGQSISEKNQAMRIEHLEKVVLSMGRYYGQSRERLQPAEKMFYLYKMEIALLSYYRVSCLLLPNRKQGRRAARRMNAVTKVWGCSLWKRIRGKYHVFILLNWFHISSEQYRFLLDSGFYRRVRKLL